MTALAPADVVRPAWDPSDVAALSFVAGLPRSRLFAILRGEANPSDTAGKAPPVTLEAVLAALGREPAGAIAAQARRDLAAACDRARRAGIELVSLMDARYPPLVARIFDPPLALWVRGSVEVLAAASVAIVGSRGASAYGEDAAARLASGLVARGFVIVSGLARGIDAAAHRGALAAGGRTVAVLGCGADVTYPPEHGALMDDVSSNGALVSELPPGSPPLRHNFPRRNRIISALSLGVVVVEARQRSGALITADCALEQGREVMAVPGNVLSERHRGSHALLKAGAALVETAEDVIEAMADAACVTPDGVPSSTETPSGSSAAGGDATCSGGRGGGIVKDDLLRSMDPGETYGLDALAAKSGDDSSALLARLLDLELRGLVRRLPGGRFVRCGGTC